ncbi:glycosyltransferase family 20-domain-containing protein [Blyttiomyces helicus]|uniref:Glycosyltransferase family 20-domain-containing protein n=1 Tax=Blyttiomyces helicus TaxID=388810 RepID=A0A4V1IRX9_9FUNG|nr:glycosyltransferase family 20-domain-containing protein [Blyttiomyces helicus]|eukprot:RKO91617.1 glycosyltransferase family 20-domain-containing protein [Blyttiomyces helicus]
MTAPQDLDPSQKIIVCTHHLPWTCVLADSPAARNPPASPRHSLAKPAPSQVQNGASSTTPPSSHNPEDLAQHPGARWRFRTRRGHSAVYSGIRSLGTANVVHVGWTGHVDGISSPLAVASSSAPEDGGCSPAESTEGLVDSLTDELLERKSCIPVFLSQTEASGHYEGYCKRDLWPLFHYILWESATDGSEEGKCWSHYCSVNQKFADAIIAAYRPGDLIWIHDYHLLLVPSMIRAVLPNACIGFFLHTPFPSSELFRCLPMRKEILEGVLGSNLIGFQTYSYARHFISSCTRVLGLESSPNGVDFKGHIVSVQIMPIGIDVERVQSRRKTQAVEDKMTAIRDIYAGKKIIVGRDKLDHIKGVQHKLNAFEKFLTLYPEWQNKVVLIQVTSPPQREALKLESKISDQVSRINGTFGSLEFAPVHRYHQHLELDDYFALLSVADVGLITSVRDGMNTTSHEFVVCQEERRGPLILSDLSAAILVNPWDYLGVAHAINEALCLSKEERSIKHQQLYKHVTSNTAAFWAQMFIRELRSCNVPTGANPTPVLDTRLLLDRYRTSKKRLMLFDYDGTLTPIVKTPNAALPPPEMLKALNMLCQDPRNVVFIISGRDEACLENWLGGIKALGLSAEHGCFIRYPDHEWVNLSEEIDFTWKNEVSEIFNYYTERTQGSFVEHKRSSITWHYRMADPEYGIFQAKECQNHLENAILSKFPIEVLLGKKNLEVRPMSINKGEIVRRLLAQHPDVDFVICAGDDRTDEDMFKSVRKSDLPEDATFTCTIGPATKKTHAQWHVITPEDIIGVMKEIAKEE